MPRNHARKQELNIGDIKIDHENPRLPKQTSEGEAISAMIENQMGKIVSLAEDINEHGLSDAERFMVMETYDDSFALSYTVLDGNRRVVALKLLANPSLAGEILKGAFKTRLDEASKQFHLDPITKADVVLFANRQEAALWMARRHSNDLKGIGQEKWSAIEIARFAASLSADGRGSSLKPEVQIFDFVKQNGGFSPEEIARLDRRLPITTLRRIIGDIYVRDKIGYYVEGNNIITNLADSEILKPFLRMVLDLANPEPEKRINVTHLEDTTARARYIDSFTSIDMPSSTATRVMYHALGETNQPIPEPSKTPANPADDEDSTEPDNPNSAKKGNGNSNNNSTETDNSDTAKKDSEEKDKNAEEHKKTSTRRNTRKKSVDQRTTIIPKDCILEIPEGRIRDIYQELQSELKYQKCINACSLLLPVFIEISLSNYVVRNKINSNYNSTMINKLKSIINYMMDQGLLATSSIVIDFIRITSESESGALQSPKASKMQFYEGTSTEASANLRASLINNLCDQWDILQPLMKIIWNA